jgi:sugar phosphate isomerase/epimerase
LERFRERLVGMHLHDIRGISDHRAPGVGDLDFSLFEASIPEFGFQTLEISPRQAFSQVRNGLSNLLKKGIIPPL